MSAAAMTILSVHLYHPRSSDIVLTCDKGGGGDMQIRISIIAGIALNGLLAERHPFIAPSFRPFIAFEGCSSRTEMHSTQLDVNFSSTKKN